MRARFSANMAKALEVILWIAERRPDVGFHKILKILFFADKAHLNRWGRPIVGGRYLAGEYGPVCSPVYDILRHDPLALEMVELNGSLPLRVQGGYHVTAEREANTRLLSQSDVEALQEAFPTSGRSLGARKPRTKRTRSSFMAGCLCGAMV